MTNERLKDLYIRSVEQDFRIPGGKSFFYQICSRKLPVFGAEEENLEVWKEQLLERKSSKLPKTPIADFLPLFEKIAYCEKKLIDSDWSSIYTRRSRDYAEMDQPTLYPLRDLFLWCLLFRRVEMAKVRVENFDEKS